MSSGGYISAAAGVACSRVRISADAAARYSMEMAALLLGYGDSAKDDFFFGFGVLVALGDGC